MKITREIPTIQCVLHGLTVTSASKQLANSSKKS